MKINRAAEQRHYIPAERVRTQRVLHFRRQPVKAAAHVRHTGDQPERGPAGRLIMVPPPGVH